MCSICEQQMITPLKICSICGDVARGLNFSVLTCISCKNFFRRNAYKRLTIPSCQFKSDCMITRRTRSYCTCCRLQKCFTLGMDPNLIRIIPGSLSMTKKLKRMKSVNDNQTQLPHPLPLDLLQNDRSTLSRVDWTLLSNLLHTFDSHVSFTRFQSQVNQLSSLPPKVRSKPSELLKFIRDVFNAIGPLIEDSPDFSSIPEHGRRVFTKHNLYVTASFTGYVLCHQSKSFDNMAFTNACDRLYGSDYVINCSRLLARYDSNANLLKILIFILAYSSNCSIVKYDDQEKLSTMSSTSHLVRLQNMYVTILWKYLLYLYGYNEAVLRYSSIIKNVLDAITLLNSIPPIESRHQLIDIIVAETERRFVTDCRI